MRDSQYKYFFFFLNPPGIAHGRYGPPRRARRRRAERRQLGIAAQGSIPAALQRPTSQQRAAGLSHQHPAEGRIPQRVPVVGGRFVSAGHPHHHVDAVRRSVFGRERPRTAPVAPVLLSQRRSQSDAGDVPRRFQTPRRGRRHLLPFGRFL